MMNNVKKPYIAPAAELILLAPMEALAAPGISTEDEVALQHWGYKPFTVASVTSKRTYWGENGKISKK